MNLSLQFRVLHIRSLPYFRFFHLSFCSAAAFKGNYCAFFISSITNTVLHKKWLQGFKQWGQHMPKLIFRLIQSILLLTRWDIPNMVISGTNLQFRSDSQSEQSWLKERGPKTLRHYTKTQWKTKIILNIKYCKACSLKPTIKIWRWNNHKRSL